MKQPIEIEIEAQQITANKIDQSIIEVRDNDKFDLLKDLTTVENPDSCIIFCRTQERVDELMDSLDRIGYPVDKIHGGMYQEDRFDVMDDFKKGIFRYLVATDVAARGIDIEDCFTRHSIRYSFGKRKLCPPHRKNRPCRQNRARCYVHDPFREKVFGGH